VGQPNRQLRHARERTASPRTPGHPISRQELADLVNATVFEMTGRVTPVDEHYIGKLERGVVRWPQDDYRTALRAILHADRDEDLGFHPHRPTGPDSGLPLALPGARRQTRAAVAERGPARQHPRRLGHHREVSADTGLEQLWTAGGLSAAFEEVAPLTSSPLDRRHFLTLTGAALATAAHEWLIADPPRLAASLAGKTADSALVADLSDGVDLLRRLDDKLGGQAVHSMVTEQFRVVIRVLQHARYSQEDGRSLHAIAAELARLAGWTSYDAGAHGTAQRYYLIGLRAAHEADAPGIGANILRCMAEQAYTGGDPRTAVALLRSARAGAKGRLSATENAVLSGVLAIAHGRADNPRAAHAAADEAQHHLAQAQPDEDPPYVYWAGPNTISLSIGSALLAAGQAQSAIPHLTESVDNTAPDIPRDVLVHRMILARAHAEAGSPDEAIRLIHQALDGSEVAASPSVTGYFTEAHRRIKATGHPGAQNLAEHARSALGSKDA